MKILLDTHTLIWALEDSSKLGNFAKDLILDERNEVYVSVISIYEVAIKNKIGKFPLDGKQIYEYARRAGFFFRAFGVEDAYLATKLNLKDENYDKSDPFDRALVAQSKVSGMKLLTHDHKMKFFDEPSIMMF